MVSAELSYNPYLLETGIQFNGKEPRINSLVEKYYHHMLQDWINQIPDIFHDEMNGFDFELCFSGTKLDYDELVDVFRKAGISDDQVPVFLKNEFESRETKVNELTALLQWMQDTPNSNFVWNDFFEANKDVLDSKFQFILIGKNVGGFSAFDNARIEVDSVDSVQSIFGLDLQYVPIIYCIGDENISDFQQDIVTLRRLETVDDAQIFFVIEQSLNQERIQRIIEDLGVEDPQILRAADDERLKKYYEAYPLTFQLKNVISLLETESQRIRESIKKEEDISRVKNEDFHTRQDQINSRIQKIKQAQMKFSQRDNLELPEEWRNLRISLSEKLDDWEKRKIRFRSEEEAKPFAIDYDRYLHLQLERFYGFLNKAVERTWSRIKSDMAQWYGISGASVRFTDPGKVDIEPLTVPKVQSYFQDLMSKNKVEYVQQNDFVNFFVHYGDDEASQPVRTVNYSCEEWRTYIKEQLIPIAADAINSRFEKLKAKEQKLAELYLGQLDVLMNEELQTKAEVMAQVSDDERALQQDKDWLQNVEDKLAIIERG